MQNFKIVTIFIWISFTLNTANTCTHFLFRTIVAVAGEDFSVIASDTRLSEGFSIHSRDQSKSYQFTKTTVLGACGFHGDVLTLTKLLKARLKVIITTLFRESDWSNSYSITKTTGLVGFLGNLLPVSTKILES